MDLVLFILQGPAGNPGLAGEVGFKGDKVWAFCVSLPVLKSRPVLATAVDGYNTFKIVDC